jgi:hypothetical protein
MKTYYERPKRRGTARNAWDFLVGDDGEIPIRMWRAFLSYWVWVMEYKDGSFHEVEPATIWTIERKYEQKHNQHFPVVPDVS